MQDIFPAISSHQHRCIDAWSSPWPRITYRSSFWLQDTNCCWYFGMQARWWSSYCPGACSSWQFWIPYWGAACPGPTYSIWAGLYCWTTSCTSCGRSTWPFCIESYGLYDGPVGARTFPLNDLAMHTIRSAVHTIWIDYTTMFDTSIWLVWPQPPTTPPPVRVFVIAQFVDFLLRIPNDWQPVLVDQQALSPGGVGVTTIRAAAYLPTPSRIEAVYDAARLSNSCLPRGLRPCWVVWRFQEWQYPSVLQPVAGDYLVVKVGNFQQYFTNTHAFFPNVRRFALDSQRILSRYTPGVAFPTWVHAIGHHFEPLGWRMIQIHIEDLLQPERLWNMAQWVWRDKLPGRNAVLHPALPQPSLGHRGRDRLHLIFAFVPKPGHQPTLYVGLQFVDASRYQFGQELQWNAVYTPQITDERGLLRASTLEYYARVTGAEYEITYIGHKVQPDVQLPVSTGAFYIVNLYAPSWIGLLESLWIEVQRNIVLQHDDTSLLQVRMTTGRTPTSSRRQSLDLFERLSPPGNGPVVDLRRDLDKLDDVQVFPWGQCCFDFDCMETLATIRQVDFELPDLQPLVDQICGASLPMMPIDFIHNHTDELPVDCWDWVDALSPTPPANFVVRQIYTDGSYDGYTEGMPTIGWGFVIFLCGPNSIYVEHIACGHISDDMTPMVHGIPIAMGARTGEIEALLQAHLWLCAAGSTVPVEVYFDAITVGFSGFGKWNFNPGDQHLRVLRSLSQFWILCLILQKAIMSKHILVSLAMRLRICWHSMLVWSLIHLGLSMSIFRHIQLETACLLSPFGSSVSWMTLVGLSGPLVRAVMLLAPIRPQLQPFLPHCLLQFGTMLNGSKSCAHVKLALLPTMWVPLQNVMTAMNVLERMNIFVNNVSRMGLLCSFYKKHEPATALLSNRAHMFDWYHRVMMAMVVQKSGLPSVTRKGRAMGLHPKTFLCYIPIMNCWLWDGEPPMETIYWFPPMPHTLGVAMLTSLHGGHNWQAYSDNTIALDMNPWSLVSMRMHISLKTLIPGSARLDLSLRPTLEVHCSWTSWATLTSFFHQPTRTCMKVRLLHGGLAGLVQLPENVGVITCAFPSVGSKPRSIALRCQILMLVCRRLTTRRSGYGVGLWPRQNRDLVHVSTQ